MFALLGDQNNDSSSRTEIVTPFYVRFPQRQIFRAGLQNVNCKGHAVTLVGKRIISEEEDAPPLSPLSAV